VGVFYDDFIALTFAINKLSPKLKKEQGFRLCLQNEFSPDAARRSSIKSARGNDKSRA
jgi:hypothetical protein